MADGKAKGGDGKVTSNTCCYSVRKCNLEKLKGFDFCHKHILEDTASPFTLCSFVAKSNGKRCTNPAPKLSDKEKSCCLIHTRKSELRKAMEERQRKRKSSSSSSVDAILTEMEEYRDDAKRPRTGSGSSHVDDENKKEEKIKIQPKIEPKEESSDETSLYDGTSSDEALKVDGAWHGDFDSDAESVDSEEEDLLKHAGVFTVEETAKCCRDKLLRLRSLYINQFDHLKHLLKERRRKFLLTLQSEEEGASSGSGSGTSTPRTAVMAATNRYHKHRGIETLLHKQAKDKRLGYISRGSPNQTRCNHGLSTSRCSKKSLPMTKYCLDHICHDPNQLLFDRCNFSNANGDSCPKPVADIIPDLFCLLHTRTPYVHPRPDLNNDLIHLADKDRQEQLEELREANKQKDLTTESDMEPVDVKPDIKELSSQLKLSLNNPTQKDSPHCKTVLHSLPAPGMITPGKELASVQPTTQAAELKPPPTISEAKDSAGHKSKETMVLLDSSAAMIAATASVVEIPDATKVVKSVPSVTQPDKPASIKPATLISSQASAPASDVEMSDASKTVKPVPSVTQLDKSASIKPVSLISSQASVPASDVEMPDASKTVKSVSSVTQPDKSASIKPASLISSQASAPASDVEMPDASKTVKPVPSVTQPEKSASIKPASLISSQASAPALDVEMPDASKTVKSVPSVTQPDKSTSIKPATVISSQASAATSVVKMPDASKTVQTIPSVTQPDKSVSIKPASHTSTKASDASSKTLESAPPVTQLQKTEGAKIYKQATDKTAQMPSTLQTVKPSPVSHSETTITSNLVPQMPSVSKTSPPTNQQDKAASTASASQVSDGNVIMVAALKTHKTDSHLTNQPLGVVNTGHSLPVSVQACQSLAESVNNNSKLQELTVKESNYVSTSVTTANSGTTLASNESEKNKSQTSSKITQSVTSESTPEASEQTTVNPPQASDSKMNDEIKKVPSDEKNKPQENRMFYYQISEKKEH